jgi:uncharacterized protein YuzE
MTRIPLVLELDDEVDAAYVALVSNVGQGAAVTQVVVNDNRIRGEIIIDLDALNNVLGIEFIGYKHMLR